MPGSLRAVITAPALVLFLALFASQTGVLVLSPVLAEVARDLGVSTSTAGQLRAVTGLVAGLLALALGRVGRSVALRELLLAGAGLLALGSLGSALAPTFEVLVAAQVLVGLGIALLISAGTAAAGEWARPEGGRRLLGWALLGPALAWVVGMPVVGLAATVSWRAAFLVLPLTASLVVAAALAMCARESLPQPRPIVPLGVLLADRTLRLWALAELLAVSAWVGTLVFAGALLVESYGTSPLLTGVVLGLVALAYLPGNLWATARVGHEAALPVLRALLLVSAACAVGLGAARPELFLSAAILALMAALNGARTFTAGSYGLAAAGERRLAVMGVRAAANQFGYLVGAAAGGIALAAGGYPALGLTFGLLFLASAAAVIRLASAARPPGAGERAPAIVTEPGDALTDHRRPR
jgi:MFS transporter, DHA1 family, inner membrane transport protein